MNPDGGGYSVFRATYDPSAWMNANNNGFVTVEIQCRLGAFGYLASAHVRKRGRLNAGLLDQHFALEWVQKHIAKFGGDPARVTIEVNHLVPAPPCIWPWHMGAETPAYSTMSIAPPSKTVPSGARRQTELQGG